MLYQGLSSLAETVLGQRNVLVVFGVGAVLLGSLAYVLANWRGWSRLPAVLAGVSAALAVAVTQGRHPFQLAGLDFSQCYLASAEAGFSESLLNVAMLVPLGASAAVATNRIFGAALLCVAVSVVLESAQGLFDTGFCVGQDVVTNTAGGACGAVVGGLVARKRCRRDRQPVRPVPSARG